MKRILYSLVCFVAWSVLLCGCIKNDIPYPSVVADITAFEVGGAISTTIDPAHRSVNLELADSVNLSKVRLLRMEVSNNAIVTPEITSVIDLSAPLVYTLTTYQEYVWTVTAVQRIDRYFQVQNQIGDAIFDVNTRMVLVTVSSDTDLKDITVLDVKLGPAGAKILPSPYSVKDYSKTVEFAVVSGGNTEIWSVLFAKSDVSVITGEANAYATYAVLSGQYKAGPDAPTFEYKKQDASQWNKLPASDVTVNGNSFSGTVSALEPNTAYVFRAVAGSVNGSEKSFTTEEARQVVNSSFDDWMKEGKSWFPDKELTPAYYWWDTGNKGANSIGEKNPTTPEEVIVVKGKAAKMASTAVLGVFAAGSIYVGEYVKTVGLGAQLAFGRPFKSRPKGLKGYYNYTPGTIDKTKAPYTGLQGLADTCFIYALLTDWTAPFDINTTEKKFIDLDNDPGIIAICQIKNGQSTNGYKEFNLDFHYRSTTRKPNYILIVATASKYGDYFTGSTSSVLYADEFELVY